MLRVALVGAGGISGAHMPVWQKMEDAEVVAICDIREEQMDKYDVAHRYTDYRQMLEKEDIDILDICLPTYLHAECSVAALEKGIHVICEKPVSLHKEDVKVIYDTAEKNQVFFMPAHVLRFWPEYVKVKEIVDSREYGKLLSGYMCRLSVVPKWNKDGWMTEEKLSGLVPYDLHIHDLDFMVYAFGTPKNVVKHRVKRPEQDYMHAVYEYEDSFITAESSWFACDFPFKAEFRFQFEQAIVALEGGKLTIYENGGNVIRSDEADSEGGAVINLPQTDAYANEIEYFANCVKTNQKPDIIQSSELEDVIEILSNMNA